MDSTIELLKVATKEFSAMTHTPGQHARTAVYLILALAGVWSLFFPSNTLDQPLHFWAVFIWSIILAIASGICTAASWAGRYRIEYVAIVPIIGCLTMYDAALWWWTFGGTGDHPSPASGGAALIILALTALVLGRLKDLYMLVTGRR